MYPIQETLHPSLRMIFSARPSRLMLLSSRTNSADGNKLSRTNSLDSVSPTTISKMLRLSTVRNLDNILHRRENGSLNNVEVMIRYFYCTKQICLVCTVWFDSQGRKKTKRNSETRNKYLPKTQYNDWYYEFASDFSRPMTWHFWNVFLGKCHRWWSVSRKCMLFPGD